MTSNRPSVEEFDSEEIERLTRLVREYESAMTEACELSAKIRHELNNILTGVLGQTQVLLLEDPSDRARRHLEGIEFHVMSMKAAVALLRDYPPAPKPKRLSLT
jgi:signal transduction histidine kinase